MWPFWDCVSHPGVEDGLMTVGAIPVDRHSPPEQADSGNKSKLTMKFPGTAARGPKQTVLVAGAGERSSQNPRPEPPGAWPWGLLPLLSGSGAQLRTVQGGCGRGPYTRDLLQKDTQKTLFIGRKQRAGHSVSLEARAQHLSQCPLVPVPAGLGVGPLAGWQLGQGVCHIPAAVPVTSPGRRGAGTWVAWAAIKCYLLLMASGN